MAGNLSDRRYRRSRFLALSVSGLAVVGLAACGAGPSASPQPPGHGSTGSATAPGTSAPSSASSASSASSPSTASSSGSPGSHPTEFNPPGDIPDSAVYVDHTAPHSRVHFSVPEGWSQATRAGATVFTDKYNSISIQVRPLASAPTPSSVRRTEIPSLKASTARFQLISVGTVKRKHGTAVHIKYLADSQPNAVTGRVVRDAVEQFDFWRGGQEAILKLSGPEHADNVDPWRRVSDSLRWK